MILGILAVLGAGVLILRASAPSAAGGTAAGAAAPTRVAAGPTSARVATSPTIPARVALSSPVPSPTPTIAADELEAPTSPSAVPAETGERGCEPGETFAALVGALGEETVGRCVEDVSVNLTTGDAQQRTTRGLLVRRKDGVTAFTDGATTWYGCDGAPVRRAVRDPAPC